MDEFCIPEGEANYPLPERAKALSPGGGWEWGEGEGILPSKANIRDHHGLSINSIL